MSPMRRNPADDAPLVWVPPGMFLMGDGAEGPSPRSPEHPVRIIRGFWLYRTPVTVGQFRRYCIAVERPMNPEHPPGEEMPITGIDWADAVEYLRWAGARLPTEAEWEYAARGAEGRRYPWGDAEPTSELAVYRKQPFDRTRVEPVGSRPAGASWCGALDMAGNVWEWCADDWDGDTRDAAPMEDPKSPQESQRRVIRGGSYDSGPEYLRASRRFHALSDRRYGFLGFRGVVDGNDPDA
jgi:formylglycine-generating enzyme required for sulfatase activity